ncbi:MAG: HAD family hydrolase [Clostridia bacterium]|nr:HAD family hydrolase [Clostridia bacterium]
MIKRVIFDIDNTLVMWKDEYYKKINNVLEELGIEYTDEDYNRILEALDEYENEYYIFDRKLMLEYINKYTQKQYPKEFIYNLTDKWANCVPDKMDSKIIETLEYLKSKYELVILTDWYADQQKERLEKLDILKYFTNVYSAEKTKRKPFKEAFMQAIGTSKPEECIMIGDNLERDIKGALNCGLKAVHYTPNNKEKNEKYYTISKLEELREIL